MVSSVARGYRLGWGRALGWGRCWWLVCPATYCANNVTSLQEGIFLSCLNTLYSLPSSLSMSIFLFCIRFQRQPRNQWRIQGQQFTRSVGYPFTNTDILTLFGHATSCGSCLFIALVNHSFNFLTMNVYLLSVRALSLWTFLCIASAHSYTWTVKFCSSGLSPPTTLPCPRYPIWVILISNSYVVKCC